MMASWAALAASTFISASPRSVQRPGLSEFHLWFRSTEDFNIGNFFYMTDQFILVLLPIHFRPRPSSQRLNLCDQNGRPLDRQESRDLGTQRILVAKRPNVFDCRGFRDGGDIGASCGLAFRPATATE